MLEQEAQRVPPGRESVLPGFDPQHKHGVYCDGQDGDGSSCAEQARRGASAVFYVWPDVRLSQRQNGFFIQDNKPRLHGYVFLERAPGLPFIEGKPVYCVSRCFPTREEAQEAQAHSLVKRVQIELGERCTAPDEPLSLPAQCIFSMAISNKLDLYDDDVLAALIENVRGQGQARCQGSYPMPAIVTNAEPWRTGVKPVDEESVWRKRDNHVHSLNGHVLSVSLDNPRGLTVTTSNSTPTSLVIPTAQLNQIKTTRKAPEHDENLTQLIQNAIALNETHPLEIQRLRETVYQSISASETRDRRTRMLCSITLMVALASGFATTIAAMPTFYGLWRIYTGQTGK